MATCRKYSGYYERLKDDVKKRYNEKLNIIGEAVDDPYAFSSGVGIDGMPSIEYPDIQTYTIFWLTLQVFTPRKSLKLTRVWRAINI